MSKGTLYIFISLVVFAFLHFGAPSDDVTSRALIGTFLGGVSYLLLAWAIVLAARPKWLESAFGGLDRMYQNHKFIGVAVLLLILAHFFAIPKLELVDRLPAEGFAKWASVPAAPVGMISMILLILMIVISLNRKIPYHIWIKPHQLMGVLFAVITFHFLLSPTQLYDGKSASGIFLFFVGIIGIVAYIYRQITRNKGAITYLLEEVNRFERVTELVFSPVDGKKLNFKPGQFGFIKLKQKGFRETHPFTISSAPSNEKLHFTMKVLGDYTRKIRDELQAGCKAHIEGPYGRFDMETKNRNQVWVAGGVGITPFLSAMREMKIDDDRNITLLYCVQEVDQALFLEEFEEKFNMAKNCNLVVLQSCNKEFATLEVIKAAIDFEVTDAEYFLCGPKPMIKGLSEVLKKSGVKAKQLHHEAFEFR